jgi:preprotein translocase subunit SecG
MGASFGSGSSQTVFGAAGGGNLLTKGTALLATLFFATSLGLAVYARQHAESLDSVDLPVPAAVEVQGLVLDEEVPVIDSLQSSEEDVPVAVDTVN